MMTLLRQATLGLLLVAWMGACGHDVTTIDVVFLASGNAGQMETRLPWGSYQRIMREEHAVHLFARLSEHHDDTTTFNAARIARLRAGAEALDVRVAFTVWSSVDAEATELEHTTLQVQLRQDGNTRECRPATQDAWTCPVRYRDLEALVRYELRDSSGDVSAHEVTIRLSPSRFHHNVSNSVMDTIGGV